MIFTLACDTIVIISQEAFIVITPDTSYSILPSIAGGLRISIRLKLIQKFKAYVDES